MRILVLGKDPTLFASGKSTFGDTRGRHVVYARTLRERFPRSEIRILTYTPLLMEKFREEVEPGLRIYGSRSRHRALFLLDAVMMMPEILRGSWRPDVVTAQEPWEEGMLAYAVARLTGARLVSQLHFDILSEDWARERWFNHIKLAVTRWILRRSQRVRLVSRAQERKLVEAMGLPRDRVSVVPVGVDFQPSPLHARAAKAALGPGLEDSKIVLFVGRFCGAKNLPLWTEVASEVARVVPEAVFVLVGDGEAMEDVRERFSAAGLADRTRLLGRVGHALLPDVYRAADVFLLTSHHEGYGRVIVEAFLSGVPVVSTACTGPEDLVDDGGNGFLLPRGDRAGLASAVVRLLEDECLRKRMGESGLDKVEAQYSLATLSTRLVGTWSLAVEGE